MCEGHRAITGTRLYRCSSGRLSKDQIIFEDSQGRRLPGSSSHLRQPSGTKGLLVEVVVNRSLESIQQNRKVSIAAVRTMALVPRVIFTEMTVEVYTRGRYVTVRSE